MTDEAVEGRDAFLEKRDPGLVAASRTTTRPRSTACGRSLVDGPDGVPELVEALRAALDGGPAVLPLARTDPRLRDVRARLAPDQPAEPGTAVVVTTSGSTGDAKGVLLSAAALRAVRGRHPRAARRARPVAARAPGRSTSPGSRCSSARCSRGTSRCARPATGSGQTVRGRPRRRLRHRRRYTSLVPTQLSRLLDAATASTPLRAFDAVLVGGAAAPAALVTRARAAGVPVVTTYGMSETGGGCVYDGVPLDGVRVRIADGVIELGGPVLAHGLPARPGRHRARLRRRLVPHHRPRRAAATAGSRSSAAPTS